MLRILLFCGFLLVNFNSWSTDFYRKINWTQKSQNVDATQNSSLNFEGSIIIDQSRLPYWVESFDLTDPNIEISIIDAIFEPISNLSIPFSDSIGSELIFKHEIGTNSGRSVVRLTVFPFVRRNGQIERLVEFTVSIKENPNHLKSASLAYQWKTSSVLGSGKWVKIKTKNKGIYKVTFDQLKSWGFSNPDQVSVYGNGGYMLPFLNKDIGFDDLNAYPIFKGKDNVGKDCLFFYSTGSVRINEDATTGVLTHKQNYYSTETYFYLSDQGTPKIISKAAELTENAARTINSFSNYAFYEKDTVNLISSGSQWFGEKFGSGQSQTISLALDNPDLTKSAQFVISAVAPIISFKFYECKCEWILKEYYYI